MTGVFAERAAAAAEPSPQQLQSARDLFADAQKSEREGNWTAALDALNRVAAVKLTPGVLYHLALCKEKLGMLVEAYKDYQAAERAAAAQNVDDVLQAVKGPLAALREKVPRLKVTVPDDVKDVRVAIDGAPLDAARFGTEVPIAAGEHRIEASAPGRVAFDGRVPTHPGEIVVVPVLLPLSSPRANDSPAGAAAAPERPALSAAPRTAALLATGGAVLLVAGGVGAFLVADGKQSDAREQCAHQTSCEELRGPVRTWDTIALGAWIGGAVASAVAIVLWLKPAASSEATARAVGPSRLIVGPGMVRGTF
jgi:hypothetical protein